MGNCKRKKFHERHNVEGEDVISNLPDSVLHHILSFLPTKDAVRFCMFSTRWKYLWTSLPNIDLDDLLYFGEKNIWSPHERTCYMNFVERVLMLHDMSNLKRFRLSCRVFFNASYVNEWVSTAVRHKVQELDICFFVEEPFGLPCCIFTCESLTALKIAMNCVLKLPNCISFPSLKSLQLRFVTFMENYSTQKLFSGCPVLQELAILDCEWMNLESITISIPTLKSLTIDELPCFGKTDDLNDCEIKIYAANLLSFKYIGNLSNDIFLYNLSSLLVASIHIPNLCERRNEIARRGVKLLRGVHNAKSVRLSNGTIESLFLAENIPDHFPIFQNLTHLEFSMEIENHTIGALMELLQSSPNLESLVFAKGLDPRIFLCEDDWNLKSVPKCFLSHLKTVDLHNFLGNDTEICFLEFLLKNALVLERINICCYKNLLGNSKKQEKGRNLLNMLPRGSRGCAIVFL
ncbi:hypothetical protein L1049_001414 [Liquidambar formosana]|uniref:F-box domain-containing protein n=1 Tax=Liquidambar formosana TaxID=63359 RepID=A0AAP0R493_LIQFO